MMVRPIAAVLLLLGLVPLSPAHAACVQRPVTEAGVAECESAAVGGDTLAALMLGDALGDAGSPRYVPAAAVAWWERAAAGQGAALRRLFDAFWFGRGVSADPGRADAYLERALAQGAGWAGLVRAVRLESADAAASAALYGGEAVAGNCRAQLRLAHGHSRGGWIEKNGAQAYFWAVVAARRGASDESHPLFDEAFPYKSCGTEAFFLRDELGRRVAAELRARAEAAAAAWVPGQAPERMGPAEAPAALGVTMPARQSASLPRWVPLPATLLRSAPKARLDPQAVFAAAGPSVWVVVAARGEDELKALRTRTGSAVAIDGNTLLTNCHVVVDMAVVYIKQGRRMARARPVAADEASDRCLLRSDDAPLTPVAGVRDYGDLKVGESVFSIGAPRGLEATLGQGLVSGLRTIKAVRYVQTTAPISAGSSGGGLFDVAGNLLGVTTFQFRESQGINFAIAAEDYFR
jgi:hypothetical protein